MEVPFALALSGAGAVVPIVLAWFRGGALFASLGCVVAAGLACCVGAVRMLTVPAAQSVWSLGWALPMGSASFAGDALSGWFLLTIGVSSVAAAIYSWGYFGGEKGEKGVWVAGALMNILVASMVLTVCAADAVLFLIGWELMSLSAFLLVGYHHREAEARRGAWMYLIATHLGMALGVVPLLGVLVARSGSTSFSGFEGAFASPEATTSAVLFFLGLLGFGTKAGIMPMHVWLPVAHPVAPSPASALLSGVVIKMGIYALLRLLTWLPVLPASCAIAMLVLGMVSGVMGVLYALAQHDLKRLLAYHSVENIGIILLGMGTGMLGQTLEQPALVALGYGGALLHVLNHALFKGLLFLSAGAVIHATGTGDIERLGGLARKTPVNAVLFLIAAVSICGLPPLNGFVSEWLVYGSLFSGAMNPSRPSAGVSVMGAVSLALMGGLALACFSKVFGVVFLGAPRDDTIQAHSTPLTMRVGMFIPAVLCAGIGLLPGVVVPLTAGAAGTVGGLTAEEFTRSIQGILAPVGTITLSAVILLTLAGALALARLALLRRNIPEGAPATLTWGCGYTRPSSRMQYTASSFAWLLIQSFRSLLWTQREVVAPTGSFPARSALKSHTPDVAEHDVFSPLLRGVGRVFCMIRTVSRSGESAGKIQPVLPGGRVSPMRSMVSSAATALRQGRIHVHLAFIVLTLLAVFFVEAISSQHPATPEPSVAKRVDGDSK